MTQQPNPSTESWSELLAGYVLGDLSSDDLVRVQAYLENNPAAIAEVESLQTTLGLLPLGLPDLPVPAKIKTQLFQAVDSSDAIASRDPVPFAPRSQPQSNLRRDSVDDRRQRRWFALAGSIAAVTVAAFGLQSYHLNQQIAATREEIARLRQTQDQLVATTSRGDRYQEAVALMRQSSSRMLTMTGNGSLAGTLGQVVIDPNQNRALLTIEKMPQPPAGKVYHLWAVVNDRKVACIQFTPEADGKVLMQLPANRWNNATKVMISLEAEQSDAQPSGDMVMTGQQI